MRRCSLRFIDHNCLGAGGMIPGEGRFKPDSRMTMNIAQMMRQVQDMQTKMADMQNRLGDVDVTGSAGGGLVTVTMNGKAEMRKITIAPKLVDPAEVEMLEDTIVAACRDAKQKAEAMIAGETEKMMGGIKLPPGVKLPF
jgi:DNA-binding YbaB/EbfC family protein